MSVDVVGRIGIDILIGYDATSYEDAYSNICQAVNDNQDFYPAGFTFDVTVIKTGLVFYGIAHISYTIVF